MCGRDEKIREANEVERSHLAGYMEAESVASRMAAALEAAGLDSSAVDLSVLPQEPFEKSLSRTLERLRVSAAAVVRGVQSDPSAWWPRRAEEVADLDQACAEAHALLSEYALHA